MSPSVLARAERPLSLREVSSRAFDNSYDLIGVGGSPSRGDMSRTGVYVPEYSTDDQTLRYLFRLCGVFVPAGQCIWLRGLRQAVTIRAVSTVAHSQGVEEAVTDLFVLEREVVSPFWAFVDGNISWHVRWVGKKRRRPLALLRSATGDESGVLRGNGTLGDGVADFAVVAGGGGLGGVGNGPFDPGQLPGTSTSLGGTDTALIYTPPLFPYRPPNAGLPYGDSVAHLGTFNDIRFPWDSNELPLAEYFEGPGRLTFWASVHQTCPTERPNPNDIPGIREEDVFVSQFPTSAVYGRVAGAITCGGR